MTLSSTASPATRARLVFDGHPTNEEVARWSVQRRRNQLDVVYADVAQASLDTADVGPVETALEGELFLRPAESLTAIADIGRKCSSELHC